MTQLHQSLTMITSEDVIRWIKYLLQFLFRKRNPMATPAIEDILSAAAIVQQTRDVRRVEVGQALVAINDEIVKQTAVDGDVKNLNVAVEDFQKAAAAFKIGDSVDPLKALAMQLFEAEGIRLVDVSSLQDAIAVRMKEQGEADVANTTEDAAISDLMDKAHNYTKEDAAPTA